MNPRTGVERDSARDPLSWLPGCRRGHKENADHGVRRAPSESKPKAAPAYDDPFFDKKVSLEEELTPYEQPLESDVVFASDHLDSDLTELADIHTNMVFEAKRNRRRSSVSISGKSDLKKAIILKEILDKPLALRRFRR